MTSNSQTTLNTLADEPDKVDASSVADSSSEIDTLRSILLGQQAGELETLQSRLSELEQRISDPASRTQDTSEVIAEAVEKRMRADSRLGVALKPVVVEQFRETSREDPEVMAEALFPILGPAVRKMIINILSPDKKTKSRGYQVEQLFLIHTATGLPVIHVAAATASTQDADMVSGMLSAIQSFVKEAFDTDELDGLNTLQLGDVSVWIEAGPQAALAAVVRGVPPKNLREALQIRIENIHHEYSKTLATYDGNPGAFDALKPELHEFLDKHDGTLKSRVNNLSDKAKKQLFVCAMLGALLLTWLCYGFYDSWRWNSYVEKLEQQPGIVVTDEKRGFKKYYVAGLRDPLASTPVELLSETSINRDSVTYRFEPYQAIHPDFILTRAHKALDPPAGVELRVENSALIISNLEDREWGKTARQFARQLAGVNHVIINYSPKAITQ